MAKISEDALKRVENALERNRIEVNDTNLTDRSKRTYINYAERFVRLLDDDFEPGIKVKDK